MDPLRHLAETAGFFTRAQARDCLYRDKDVTGLVRGGSWLRLKRGYFTFTDLWQGLDHVQQFRVRGAMAMHSLGDRVALSHQSALAEQQVDIWGLDTTNVHVTRLDGGAGRIESGIVHHEGLVIDDDVVERGGLRMLSADRSALEAAIRADNEAALCVLDSLLRVTDVSPEQLMERFKQMQHWPGIRHLHIPVRMADGRSASPGESRGRWFCWRHNLPAPQLQYDVYDDQGLLRGTCDWCWPASRLLGEFDGKAKYGRLLKPGQDPGEVVFAEKQREDLLRELTGFQMIRLVWTDYQRPQVLEQRFRKMLRIAS